MHEDQVQAETAPSAWLVAASVDELEPGDMKRIETAPPVALFRVDDDYYATADTCTHVDYPLTEGYLDGDKVECGLHMAQFCVRTGRAVSLPATTDLATFAVRLDGGVVLVGVDDRVLVSAGLEIRPAQ